MAQKAGPARAAGRLAPADTGRLILGPRKVRIETRTGTVRAKKGAPAPTVELELGADERVLDFVIDFHRPSPLAPLDDRVAFNKRKTIDWEWKATVECPVPAPRPAGVRRPAASRRRRSTGNGSHGRKDGA